jgi:hypothetical protein
VNFVIRPPTLFLLLYTRSATESHNHQSVGAPDQGTRSNEVWDLVPFRWTSVGVNPTFSPFDFNLILILILNLILKLNIHFITDQYIERLRHNSQLRITRFNNYHVFFYSEIDSYLILWTLVSNNHRLSLKPMPATCSLNTLGGKSFINGSTNIYLVLMCSRLIV